MSLAQKIRSRIDSGTRLEHDDDALIEVHHIFMREYGWIPLEEFKNLPLPTMFNLMNCIKREKEQEAKAAKKMKGR